MIRLPFSTSIRWREWRSAAWEAASQAMPPERLMAQRVTDDYHAKQGRSTGRWVPPADSKLRVYLKRHYHLPLRTRLLAWLLPRAGWSPGWSELRSLRWAAAQGIPVPEPLAAGERQGPGLHLQSYLVVRELTDCLPLHEAIPLASEKLAPAEFALWKRQLIREISRLARRLHAKQRYHRDLYLCHFFVPRQSVETGILPEGAVTLIDFHRLCHSPLLGFRWLVKDLAELLYSSQLPGVTARDRLRFFRLYRGERRTSLWQQLLVRLVCGKASRYTRANWEEVQRLNTPRHKMPFAPLSGAST